MKQFLHEMGKCKTKNHIYNTKFFKVYQTSGYTGIWQFTCIAPQGKSHNREQLEKSSI